MFPVTNEQPAPPRRPDEAHWYNKGVWYVISDNDERADLGYVLTRDRRHRNLVHAAGHRVESHSFAHHYDLTRRAPDVIRRDIARLRTILRERELTGDAEQATE